MTDKGSIIQVQPKFLFREEWEILAEAEDLRYEALDFSMPPALIESGLFEEYLDWYSSCGRTFSLHGFFMDVNPACSDPGIRDLSRSRCRKSCETAVACGAKNVVFHSSCFPFLRGIYLDAWAARCAEFYQGLTEEFNINIYIENSPDIDAGPIKTLMKRIDDKRIGVCLDIGHAHYSNIPVSQWFEELGEWIGYLHLSDNMGKYDDHLPLGDGTIDWEEADRLWRGLDRDTVLTIEVSSMVTAGYAVRFLRNNDYFGCGGEKE